MLAEAEHVGGEGAGEADQEEAEDDVGDEEQEAEGTTTDNVGEHAGVVDPPPPVALVHPHASNVVGGLAEPTVAGASAGVGVAADANLTAEVLAESMGLRCQGWTFFRGSKKVGRIHSLQGRSLKATCEMYEGRCTFWMGHGPTVTSFQACEREMIRRLAREGSKGDHRSLAQRMSGSVG